MNSSISRTALRIGRWCAERSSGELHGPEGVQRLEPKVMDLLFLLAAEPGDVVARERILEVLWPGMVVGEDTLARTVSKLRRALGDDARMPTQVETISKRGYRLLAPVSAIDDAVATPPGHAAAPGRARAARPWWLAAVLAVVLVALVTWLVTRAGMEREPAPGRVAGAGDAESELLARADDFYFQYARADNEAAIALYQRVLAQRPDHAPALAGLANALVQKSMRWPQEGGRSFTQLGDALRAGHLATPAARRQLQRARQLAERAVELAPELAAAHKALGLVRSASGELDEALAAYERALQHDPQAWGSLINIGDVLEIQGRAPEALPYFERAYAAMAQAYPQESARIRPWHAHLGVLIAERHAGRGDAALAEAWYLRVLAHSPLDPAATRGLALLLRAGGDASGADRLCRELQQRTGAAAGCAAAPP